MHSSGCESIRRCFPSTPSKPAAGRCPTLGIELSHPLDMAREVPFRDEGGVSIACVSAGLPLQRLSGLLKPARPAFRARPGSASRMLGKSTLLNVPE
jgi:hypothetical protein